MTPEEKELYGSMIDSVVKDVEDIANTAYLGGKGLFVEPLICFYIGKI